MNKYHKINTFFKRDMSRKGSPIVEGDWTMAEYEYLAMNTWVFTEKVDGTNIRVMINGGSVRYAGKTDSAQIPGQLLIRLNELFSPVIDGRISINVSHDICLYGEGYGAKIQKGECYKKSQDFVLFDVRIGDNWLDRMNVQDVANKLGIETVPIIGQGTLYDAINAVKVGFNSAWGDFRAEGIVARPKVELQTRLGERIITKIKCRDFN